MLDFLISHVSPIHATIKIVYHRVTKILLSIQFYLLLGYLVPSYSFILVTNGCLQGK